MQDHEQDEPRGERGRTPGRRARAARLAPHQRRDQRQEQHQPRVGQRAHAPRLQLGCLAEPRCPHRVPGRRAGPRIHPAAVYHAVPVPRTPGREPRTAGIDSTRRSDLPSRASRDDATE